MDAHIQQQARRSEELKGTAMCHEYPCSPQTSPFRSHFIYQNWYCLSFNNRYRKQFMTCHVLSQTNKSTNQSTPAWLEWVLIQRILTEKKKKKNGSLNFTPLVNQSVRNTQSGQKRGARSMKQQSFKMCWIRIQAIKALVVYILNSAPVKIIEASLWNSYLIACSCNYKALQR